MEEHYAVDFYHHEQTKIYGYTGNPYGAECTLYLRRDIQWSDRNISLIGSIQISENESKSGRELVMAGTAPQVTRDPDTGKKMRCINALHINPPFSHFDAVDHNTPLDIRLQLLELANTAPKHLRPEDQEIYESELAQVARNQGPLIEEHSSENLGKRKAANAYLQCTRDLHYRASNPVNAVVIPTPADSHNREGAPIPWAEGFLVPGATLDPRNRHGEIQAAEAALTQQDALAQQSASQSPSSTRRPFGPGS